MQHVPGEAKGLVGDVKTHFMASQTFLVFLVIRSGISQATMQRNIDSQHNNWFQLKMDTTVYS